MNTIVLEPETCSLLDRIRHRSEVLSVYDMPSDLAAANERLIYKVVEWKRSEFMLIRCSFSVT